MVFTMIKEGPGIVLRWDVHEDSGGGSAGGPFGDLNRVSTKNS